MDEKIKEQILKIRDTRLTNMFAVNAVQVIASQMGFYELAVYLDEHSKEYVNFILYGDA